jgi:hypothetical protein
VVLSSVPSVVNGVEITKVPIPEIAKWVIQRIYCAGFRKSRSRMKTTGSNTSPLRDKVNSKGTMIGTSMKP